MRTMAQVWIIVSLPLVGLVIITSLVVALVGLGNYRYDGSTDSIFVNSSCFVESTSVQPFSHTNPDYTSNCEPTIINCYEALWQVIYNNNVNGQIFSSGITQNAAYALISEFRANDTYDCWYLPSSGVVSWEDWSPTEQDIQNDVKIMQVSFGLAAGTGALLLGLLIGYFKISPEHRPIKSIAKHNYQSVPSS